MNSLWSIGDIYPIGAMKCARRSGLFLVSIILSIISNPPYLMKFLTILNKVSDPNLDLGTTQILSPLIYSITWSLESFTKSE